MMNRVGMVLLVFRPLTDLHALARHGSLGSTVKPVSSIFLALALNMIYFHCEASEFVFLRFAFTVFSEIVA
jgi:hypothetical protein